MRAIKKVISNIVDWFLYTLLSDEQKERLSNLFSEGQKDLIRKVTQHGKRRKQKMYVKQIKDNVYSLGLRKKGLQQFQTILQESKDLYLKRLVAW
ncbi:MAG TPA: glycosyltransferase family 2 protein, partial [Pseudogracilibacillus sp.]|nr:glycosyltransferase family 2 protein [Pseudogracilibacillus sp.]